MFKRRFAPALLVFLIIFSSLFSCNFKTSLSAKDGWAYVNSSWHYYKNGSMVKNEWEPDSFGWCYLNEQGDWVQEGWALDFHGWCYILHGYWVNNAMWTKDSNGWVRIGDDGYWDGKPAAKDLFGSEAYTHVDYIQNNLRSRIAGTASEKNALAYIKSELMKFGYSADQIKVQNFKYAKDGNTIASQNVIAVKKGISDKSIVVGAHYDCADTHGVDDNGSGVAEVLESADKLYMDKVPYTIIYIFFGAEEDGDQGSQYYLNSLTESERKNIILMVNLDSILAGDKEYIFGGSVQDDGSITDTWAVEQTKIMADKLGLNIYLNPNTNPNYKSPTAGNWSDHTYFKKGGIPYVYFGAGNWNLYPYGPYKETEKLGQIMHTARDDLAMINTNFDGRAMQRLTDYSELLYQVLIGISPVY